MHERELRRAVCETPDDDGPRMVMADWFAENPLVPCPDGDGLVDDGSRAARAEYVRLSCRADRGLVCSSPRFEHNPRKRYVFESGRPCGVCDNCQTMYQSTFLRSEWSKSISWLYDDLPWAFHDADPGWSRGYVASLELRTRHDLDDPDEVRDLFERSPVTWVGADDAVGVREYGGGDDRHTIYRWAGMPEGLWVAVCGGDPDGLRYNFREFHHDRNEARRHFSKAVVAWGRSLAGLSPIDWSKLQVPPGG